MELDIIKLRTTWNDAAGSINSNYAKIADAIAQLKADGGGGGGGADIDLTNYATKVWVEANYAPLTSVQGFENRIGGLEGAVPQLNNRVTTVEGKVSSLNEIVSTGENNLLDRVNTIETDYVTSGDLESAINGIDLSAYLLKADLTKSRIQSTLGISDWALATTKPSYTAAEVGALSLDGTSQMQQSKNIVWSNTEGDEDIDVFSNGFRLLGYNTSKGNYGGGIHIGTRYGWQLMTKWGENPLYYRSYNINSQIWRDWEQLAFTSDIPTKLSQFTDDVVAGKYLPLSGGTVVGEFAIKAGAANSATIRFSPNDGAINHWLGVNSAGVLWFTNNGWSQQYDILHSGNIGNYEAGSSVWSKGLDRITSIPASGHCVYFYSGQPTLGDDINNAKEGSNAYHLWSYPVNGTSVSGGAANIMNLRLQWNSAYLHDIYVSPNFDDVWHRSIINNICNPWRKFAFTDSNVASATKLATPRKLWGNDFDGTADVSGNLFSDIWRIIKASNWNGTFIQSANYDGTSELGNIYMTAMHGSKLISFNVWANNSKFSDNVTVDGNVGIGTTSPTERLDVSGNIKASGNINATSITINGVTITASNGTITVNGNVFAKGDITGGV